MAINEHQTSSASFEPVSPCDTPSRVNSPALTSNSGTAPPQKLTKAQKKQKKKNESSTKSISVDGDNSTGGDEEGYPSSGPRKDLEINDNKAKPSSEIQQVLEMMHVMQRKLQEMEIKIDERTQPSSNSTVPPSATTTTSAPSVTPTTPSIAPSVPSTTPAVSSTVPSAPPSTTPSTAPTLPSIIPTGPKSQREIELKNSEIDPHIDRRISLFRSRAAETSQPQTLFGSRNFEDWKQDVLAKVRPLACIWILENKEEECPPTLTDRKTFWEVQNTWLYEYILKSVDSKIKSQISKLKTKSAYLLWAEIESKFNRSIEEERRFFLHKLLTCRGKDDKDYIAKFNEWRTELKNIGLMVPHWILMDFLWMGISQKSRDFVQLQIESKRISKYTAVALNVDNLLDEILDYLKEDSNDDPEPEPQVSKKSNKPSGIKGTTTSFPNIHASVYSHRPDSQPSGDIECYFCAMPNHREEECFYKYPGRTSAKWQQDHSRGIEFFKGQAKAREANSAPAKECSFCGGKKHTADGCYYKHTEMKSATWRKENKNLIEYFRKNAEKRTKTPQNDSPATIPSPNKANVNVPVARPPSPQTDLLIMDL